ncbi:MAG TPA: NAD(P)/FAD-dependent oxidoreductase [Bryobacteraceae bacterium]|jgi:monoamine oxidase
MDSPLIIVIGAGVAGLAAARHLTAAGRHVLILEARSRLGGRILTRRDGLSPLPIELGAEFVHGSPRQLWRIIDSARLPTMEVMGDNYFSASGQLQKSASQPDQFDKVYEAMKQAPEQSVGDFIANANFDEATKQQMTAYLEGFNAASKETLSTGWVIETEEAGLSSRTFRMLAGYDELVSCLWHGVESRLTDLRLNTEVRAVRWHRGEVEVETAHGVFKGEKCVVTAPIGVLAAGTIRFDPAPPVLRAVCEAMDMGQVIRIVMRFRERFWERGGKEHMSFLFSDDEVMPTWWTAMPARTPAITGWTAGPKAAQLLGRSEHAVTVEAAKALARVLGCTPNFVLDRLEAAHYHDWHADIWSRGAYCYVRPGGMDVQRWLGQPLEDTLYFAGEATEATGNCGTVHGAIASGSRVGRAIAGPGRGE